MKDNLVSLLKQNYFNFDVPAYFLWEGNITLILKSDVIFVLNKIRDNFNNFRLSFDYMSKEVILRKTGYQVINGYIEKYESRYAPWLSGIDDIETLAKKKSKAKNN